MPNHYVVTPDARVLSYRTFSAASAAAANIPDAVLATDVDITKVPTATLVTLYNIIRPERPIKKFADRETAEQRMKGVLEVLAKPGEAPAASATTEETEGDMATKTKTKRAAKKATATDGNGAGRPSAFSGKVIRKLVDENPRREGTFGYASFALIKNGMTYEKYIEAGGRRQDLAWDIERKYVKLENA
jgi:hypothetical protein